jgi:hypothetical protein
MRLKGIHSIRELTRILDVDRRLRRLCLIHGKERGYPRSVISRFTRRVGVDVLQLIIEEKVIRLLGSRPREVDVLLDASFIKARSIRHPDDGRVAYSDPDGWWGGMVEATTSATSSTSPWTTSGSFRLPA